MNTGIYEIVNTVNGKRYVGSAVNLRYRLWRHRRELRLCIHHSSHLQRAWDKYGEGAFEFRKILVCSKENLLMYEQRAIDGLVPEYNVNRNARSPLGVKRTKEFCAAIALRQIGNKGCLGYKHTDEARAKISASKIGKPCVGHAQSEEAKEKISAAHRGRKHTEESRANMSAAHKGKPWSEARMKAYLSSH